MYLVTVEKVRRICRWLVGEGFIISTFSEDLFFPAEINIDYEKLEQVAGFAERSTRDVGVNFDEIYGFMQSQFHGNHQIFILLNYLLSSVGRAECLFIVNKMVEDQLLIQTTIYGNGVVTYYKERGFNEHMI